MGAARKESRSRCHSPAPGVLRPWGMVGIQTSHGEQQVGRWDGDTRPTANPQLSQVQGFDTLEGHFQGSSYRQSVDIIKFIEMWGITHNAFQ